MKKLLITLMLLFTVMVLAEPKNDVQNNNTLQFENIASHNVAIEMPVVIQMQLKVFDQLPYDYDNNYATKTATFINNNYSDGTAKYLCNYEKYADLRRAIRIVRPNKILRL